MAKKLPFDVEITRIHHDSQEFDIDKAMNTEGFVQFLASQSEAKKLDMNDGEKVRRSFETFESMNLVSKELKQLYTDKIEKEMGLKLTNADRAYIDEYIANQALENPEFVIKKRDKLYTYKQIPTEIQEYEKQLDELGSQTELTEKLERLKQDKQYLETAKKSLSIFGKAKLSWETAVFYAKAGSRLPELLYEKLVGSENPENANETNQVKEQWEALRVVKEKYGDVNKKEALTIEKEVEKQIASIEGVLTTIKEVEQLKSVSKELYDSARKDLVKGVSDMKVLTEIIQDKIFKQLLALNKKNSIKDFDAVQERFDALKKVAKTTETGIDPLGGMDDVNVQEMIDEALEKAASEQVMETVLRTNLGTNALTKFEKALQPFLEREKLGSKEGDEARDLITKTLEEVVNNLGDTNEDKAKMLIVKRIIIRMKS